jgi:hypothetical protein
MSRAKAPKQSVTQNSIFPITRNYGHLKCFLSNPDQFCGYHHNRLHLDPYQSFEITEDQFFHFISDLNGIQPEKFCSFEIHKMHSMIVENFHKLFEAFVKMSSSLPKTKQERRHAIAKIHIFVSQVSIIRILFDDLSIKFAKLRPQQQCFNLIESVQMILQKEKMPYLSILQEYLNNLNTRHNIDMHLVKRSNKHSSLGSFKAISNMGFGTMVRDIENMKEAMGYEQTDKMSALVFHSTRNHKCILPISDPNAPDRQSIKSIMEMFISGKELKFLDRSGGYVYGKKLFVTIQVSCPNKHSFLHKIKAVDSTFTAADMKDDGDSKEEKEQSCCGKPINLDGFYYNKIKMISIGDRHRYMTQQEHKEYCQFYHSILVANKDTAFPDRKIVFCPDSECEGSHGIIVEKDMKNCRCVHCFEVFCSQCCVPGVHSGNDCNAEFAKAQQELGANGCYCPNYPKCTVPISRIDGCDKMICEKEFGGCGTAFCWVCKQKTALQISDLISYEQQFKEMGREIEFAPGHKAWLYIHANNECPNSSTDGMVRGVFQSTNIINIWIRTDVVYRETRTYLTPEDCDLLSTLMQTTIEHNTK